MAPEETVGLLEAMRKAVAAGTSPAVAAQEVKAILPLPIVQSPPARQDDTRFDSLEGAVLVMASQVGKLVEENRRLSGEVAALRGEIAQARPALAPPIPVELPRKAILWSPEPARDPADGLPWYRRAWLEIFEPERLRKTAS